MSQILVNVNKLACTTPNCKNLIDIVSSRSGKKLFCKDCIQMHKSFGWHKRYYRKKRNAWQRRYDWARYHTDLEFKKIRIATSIKYQKEHRKERNLYQNGLYARRTPEEIQKRKNYLKQLRSKKIVISC
jgi:hypothetical protein